MERVRLTDAQYVDGSEGTIQLEENGRFSLPLRFWKKLPGVYTIVVWIHESGDNKAFLGAMTSVFVEERKKDSR
jgi:hypothetical protein